MFINYSNHPSDRWSKEQYGAALEYGDVYDMPFLSVPPQYTREQVQQMAKSEAVKIASKKPTAVLCVGDFSMTYALVNELKKRGITVLSACSERETVETTNDAGETVKTAVFKFVRFREY